MAYTVHQAKTHFSRLLKEAEAGQEVVVMRGKKPVAKIVPINEPSADGPGPNFRLIGAYAGQISWDEDAFEPMTGQELIESGLGYMLDAALTSPLPSPPAAPSDK
jgi:prevent-host-death family protein